MDDRSYYFSEERLVFLTIEDARKFFFNEELYNIVDDCDLNAYLSNRFNYYELFTMTNEDKADVLSDYHEYLFDCWVDDELIACDMYED